MPKPSKSSASSGTRKKHARKAAGGGVHDNPQIKIVSNSGKPSKRSKKHEPPRPKGYIPPVKPAPPRPDPLETLGIASSLPPELVISLRILGKKDPVTKQRALQDLQSSWTDKAVVNGNEEPSIVETLEIMLPVWFHHYPALVIHPAKRVRLLAASMHSALLDIPSIRKKILYYLDEGLDPSDININLGGWFISSFDVDTQVALKSCSAWENAVTWGSVSDSTLPKVQLLHHISPITSFLLRSISEPSQLYQSLYPVLPSELERKEPGKQIKSQSSVVEDRPMRSVDSEEESDIDRQARLRHGAFGALKWMLEVLSPEDMAASDQPGSLPGLLSLLLSDPSFWSVLYHGPDAPFDLDKTSPSAGYGSGQPLLRCAGWRLLTPLTGIWNAQLQPHLPLASAAVLRSAWVESDQSVQSAMWEPLLRFLTRNPSAWLLEAQPVPTIGNDEDEDSSSQSDNELGNTTEAIDETADVVNPSAYIEFLEFLRLGCNGSPIQGYPTVLVVVSTLPKPVRPSTYDDLTTFFSSLWAAVDGRVIGPFDRGASSSAFTSALLECLVFFVSRLWKEGIEADSMQHLNNKPQIPIRLVAEQTSILWSEYNDKSLELPKATAAVIVAKFFQRLEDQDKALLEAAWSSTTASNPSDTHLFREVVRHLAPHGSAGSFISHYIRERAQLLVSILESLATKEHTPISQDVVLPSPVEAPVIELADILSTFHAILGPATWKLVDGLLLQHLHWLMLATSNSSFTHLISEYLSFREELSTTQAIWDSLLNAFNETCSNPSKSTFIILELTRTGRLPIQLIAGGHSIAALVKTILNSLLHSTPSSNYDPLLFLQVVLERSALFLQESTLLELYDRCVSSFTSAVQAFPSMSNEQDIALHAALSVLNYLTKVQDTTLQERFEHVLPELFIFSFLSGDLFLHPNANRNSEISQDLWRSLVRAATPDVLGAVLASVRHKLRNMISETTVEISPALILSAARRAAQSSGDLSLEDIILPRSELETKFSQLDIQPNEGSLEALMLYPPKDVLPPPLSYDSWGLSSYGRIIWALLEIVEPHRDIGKQNAWILPHLIVFTTICLDHLQTPGAGKAIFGPGAEESLVQSLMQRSQQMSAYYLSLLFSDLPSQWHGAMTEAFKHGQYHHSSISPNASQLLNDVYSTSTSLQRPQDQRVFRAVIECVLRNASVDDAGAWVALSQAVWSRALYTSFVTISVITGLGFSPPGLDRYRNELASKLSGTPAKHANSEGRRLIQLLIACAPLLDSDVIFLPQQRAVFLLQAFQKWIASDEELDEAIDSLLVHLFIYLAPIVQSVQGAHWDLIFDLVEANLESVSFTKDETLTKLNSTLQLINTIDDLASTNKTLRGIWDTRLASISELIIGLLLESVGKQTKSQPRTNCQMMVLRIATRKSLAIDEERGLPMLCNLLTHPSIDMKIAAYRLLETLAYKRTERFVMEAAVDLEGEKHGLPLELLSLLRDITHVQPRFESDVPSEQRLKNHRYISSLLAWMIAFDLFTNTSLKLRNEYLEHLRNLGVVEHCLLPGIFGILRVGDGPLQAKLGIWEVDEFYIELIDESLEALPEVLAAHIYYRSLKTVPSLVRDWWLHCKDRQFSGAVGTLTSRYFSPPLITRELAQLRQPDVTSELQDDAFTIKLSSSTHEVLVKYLIDDQPMEISIKLPSDFPLHGVELKDMRRVGVPETAWRGWLLNVQKLSQSGMILEALSYFKKNVTLHFEGIVECAICYSIISATDQSMPKKPCRTCKNRFHASCLMKWFETSSLSTCPLCRSDIL